MLNVSDVRVCETVRLQMAGEKLGLRVREWDTNGKGGVGGCAVWAYFGWKLKGGCQVKLA